jgi:hypothetical protein
MCFYILCEPVDSLLQVSLAISVCVFIYCVSHDSLGGASIFSKNCNFSAETVSVLIAFCQDSIDFHGSHRGFRVAIETIMLLSGFSYRL